MSWRDIRCGELRPDHVGQRLTVAGWVDTRRDHGGLVFVDLRDHSGKIQLVLKESDRVHELRNEFVVQAVGQVAARAPEAVNPNLATGEVEIQVESLQILSRSTPLPFQIGDDTVEETTRLRYRWLDMRGERMQRNLRMSHAAIAGIRRTMDELGFVDVWTPAMTRGTPEGARDFLVPVRLQPGKFFALAQSPQLFKQLCMIGGLDRYYQIATCWRDEDLRADRQFEFRQLDLEMAFVEREDVLAVMEAAVVGAFEAVGKTPPPRPFPHITYDDAMRKYGSDKPDLRFGMEIQDATAVTRGSEFGVFANAPCVRYLIVPKTFSRAEHDRLVLLTKEWGAKGLANLSQVAKFLSEEELESFGVPEGSSALCVADTEEVAAHVLGLLRLHLAQELDVIPDTDVFHWVVDFPLFKHDEETGAWTFMHHPFTAPTVESDVWDPAEPQEVRGQHYDLVWNGWELGSGSIRIHDVDVQERVFKTMGMTDEEAASKFGFLLDALAMGAPPHGGFAMGIERFVARLVGEPDIRQIVAFPKVSSGSDPLTGAPTPMPDDVLAESGIRALPQEPPAKA
ncbi:MAG: aspartate--tRNA ligase [Gaiellaceae bacterium]